MCVGISWPGVLNYSSRSLSRSFSLLIPSFLLPSIIMLVTSFFTVEKSAFITVISEYQNKCSFYNNVVIKRVKLEVADELSNLDQSSLSSI